MLVFAALLLLGMPLLLTLQKLPAEPALDEATHQLLRLPPVFNRNQPVIIFLIFAVLYSFCILSGSLIPRLIIFQHSQIYLGQR